MALDGEQADYLITHGWINVAMAFPVVGDARYSTGGAGPPGPTGPPGPIGAQGPAGPQGPTGLATLGCSRYGTAYKCPPVMNIGGIGTGGLAANTLNARCIYFATPTTINDIGVIVTTGTGVTTSYARYGLYALAGDNGPGALLWDSGNLSTQNAGRLAAAPGLGALSGWYWFVTQFSQQTTCATYPSQADMWTCVPTLTAGIIKDPYSFQYASFTFAAFPASLAGQTFTTSLPGDQGYFLTWT